MQEFGSRKTHCIRN